MEYEEENHELRNKLHLIELEISELKSINQQLFFTSDPMSYITRQNLEKKLLLLEIRRGNIEEVLAESPMKRKFSKKISKILQSLPDVNIPDPPKKVISGGVLTKPVYSMSSGCFSWIVIGWLILAVLFFIVYSFSKN